MTDYYLWHGMGQVDDLEDEDPQDDKTAIDCLFRRALQCPGDWTLWKRVDFGQPVLVAVTFNRAQPAVREDTRYPSTILVTRESTLTITER